MLSDTDGRPTLSLFHFDAIRERILEFIEVCNDEYFREIIFHEVDGFDKPLPAARPPIFGDGHAAERIAELTVAHLDRTREKSVV